MFNLKPKPRTFLGLDIQPTAVRLCQLAYHAEQFKVLSAAVLPLPKGVVDARGITSPEAFMQLLKPWLKDHITCARVAIALPLELATLTHVTVPSKLSARERLRVFEQQVKTAALHPAEAMHYVTHPLTSPDHNTQRFLLIMLAQRVMASYLMSLTKLGLTVQWIDLENYALARIIYYTIMRDHTSAGFIAIILSEQQWHFSYVVEQEIIDYQQGPLAAPTEFAAEMQALCLKSVDAAGVAVPAFLPKVYIVGADDAYMQALVMTLTLPITAIEPLAEFAGLPESAPAAQLSFLTACSLALTGLIHAGH